MKEGTLNSAPDPTEVAQNDKGRSTRYSKSIRGMDKYGFGRRLVALRTKADMTQTELSAALKAFGLTVTQGAISKMERRMTASEGDIVLGLAKVFDTTPNYLLGITDDPSPADQPAHLLSVEAEEVARLVDSMPPDVRVLFVRMARATASSNKAMREQNLEQWRHLMALVDELIGPAARKEIEARLIAGAAGSAKKGGGGAVNNHAAAHSFAAAP